MSSAAPSRAVSEVSPKVTSISFRIEVKSRAVKDVSDWLSERLVEQRAKVQASEEALQQFAVAEAARLRRARLAQTFDQRV